MKAEILKIAGVKSEKEFYKKFPSEEAFMKKHGKAMKTLMAKKAQVGAMVPNIESPTQNLKPIRIDDDYLFNTVSGLTGGKNIDQIKKDKMYDAQMAKLTEAPKKNNLFGDIAGLLGDSFGDFEDIDFESMDFGEDINASADIGSLAKSGIVINKAQDGTNFAEKTSKFMKSDGVQNFGLPIVSDVIDIRDQINSQKDQLNLAKQSRMISEVALQAANTQPERIEREYVRPEDIQNTGEEFFPIYGVGTNVLAKNGVEINDMYSPLVNSNMQKTFGKGGYLKKAQGGFDASNISYGGGSPGQLGTSLGQAVGFNDDAGGRIGGKIGGTIGSAFGPIGSAVGSFIGSGIGDLLDRNDVRQGKENARTERFNKELSYSAVAPAIQAGYASNLKSGGSLKSNPSMLDVMQMGGELKTLWGGKAETVSYNPYAGGESIEFKGNSHETIDPKTGQTGIGVAYGQDAVANNKAVVEVENEPAQKLQDGGGDESLVVFGDLKIPEEYVPEINDDRAKGKKFKNYVNILNEDESKINKKMEKAAEKGLDSDNSVWGQLERSTANAIISGSDQKLKSIAEKKNVLSDLQSALNDTFDEYGIKGNEFINKNKIVQDPERIENAKYGKSVKKAQDGSNDTLDLKTLPEKKIIFNTEQEALDAGYVKNEDGTFSKDEVLVEAITKDNPLVEIKELPKGQRKANGNFYGTATEEKFEQTKQENSWYDWEGFDPNDKEDVKKYQTAFNKRATELGLSPSVKMKVDGKIGDQTVDGKISNNKIETAAETKKVFANVNDKVEEPSATKKTKIPAYLGNFLSRREDEPLDPNQLLAERYAMSTNQVQPVYAQTFSPRLNVPYDISMQDRMNEITSQSRALQRNPAIQANPAAQALLAAPMYEAINKTKAEEFRANQAMRNSVYAQNIDAINKANAMNLGIYDVQQDRQAEAASKTRTQNIDILSSISNKYAQKKLEDRMERVYENMYPTFRFNNNYQTEVQRPTTFNNVGQQTIPFGGAAGNNPVLQAINLGMQALDYTSSDENKKEKKKAKRGKTIKNNKNSNILKALRNL